MGHRIFIFFCSIFLAYPLLSQNKAENGNLPFTYGEKLKYIMHFGWVDGGEAKLELIKSTYNGSEAYHAVAVAKTISLVEKFYKVHDVYQSFYNISTVLPYKAIRDIHEDRYKYYNEVTYYHLKDSVFSLKSGWHKIPKPCFDMISAFYYLRASIAKKGKAEQVFRVDTYFADEIFPLVIKFKGLEKISTRIGTFECMKFVPVVETGRVFDDEDDLTLWISNDKNMVPVRMQLDMIVGSLKLDLVEYSGLKYKFTAHVKK